MPSKSQSPGFSIVELSIIITIISIATVGMINFGIAPINDDADKINQTLKKMQEIDKAIKSYFVIYDRLPCPAKRSLSMGEISNETYSSISYNFSFDSEYIAYTSTNGNECLSPLGAVPTKNLGLPSSYILDGWGRKFNYHVDNNLCGNNSVTTKNCTPSSYKNNNASIQILSSINGSNLVNNAAYVLVSYGPNGYSSYSSAGVYNSSNASTNTYEQANDASKNPTAPLANTYYKGPSSTVYDDIVLFGTKAQLAAMKYLPSNPVITSSECANNSYLLRNSTISVLNNIRSLMDVTQINNGASIYNYGDEAALEMMWILQEACYGIYGYNESTSTMRTRRCSGGTSPAYDLYNACCPVGLTYDNNTNSCS